MQCRCNKSVKSKSQTKVEDVFLLEDSTIGTLCTIHHAINSTVDNFPRHKCDMNRESIARCRKLCNKKIARQKHARSRSSSPCKIVNCTAPRCQPCWATVLHKSCGTPPRREVIECDKSSMVKPNICKCAPESKNVGLEKTTSCPGTICRYNSAKVRPVCAKSRPVSSCQIYRNYAFSDTLLSTDEMVTELRGQIEKVKKQIHHISMHKGCKVRKSSCSESTVDGKDLKLKSENKKLKKELEMKEKLLQMSKVEVEKARDILGDYEEKVTLLHTQALKSAKVMKISKEKFCKCLTDRDEKIKELTEKNESLLCCIKEKQNKCEELKEECDNLSSMMNSENAKCMKLSEANREFCSCIEELKNKLKNANVDCEEQKREMMHLEKSLREANCAYKKMCTKNRKQKESYEIKLKRYEEKEASLKEEISSISTKMDRLEKEKKLFEDLKTKYNNIQCKMQEYEKLSSKCESLENDCKRQCETIIKNEKIFAREREEMRKLVEELTNVVKQNKETLLHMSTINKQHEKLIEAQSQALLAKDEQIRLAESTSDQWRTRSDDLEKEIEELRKALSDTCNNESCTALLHELNQIRCELESQKDLTLLKEKVINDQSTTILSLQHQVKVQIEELSQAHRDTSYLEQEISKVNEELLEKHRQLDKELDEKEDLMEKLKALECHKDQLTGEIDELGQMLNKYMDVCKSNENQKPALDTLQKQIAEQKQAWESQKANLEREKEIATNAAKFATEKLLETVADFQKQVDCQKKVQMMLTKMLHSKEEQLKSVSSKMSSISEIIRYDEIPMKELFRADFGEFSNPTTTASFYSTCSNVSKKPISTNAELEEILNMLSMGCQEKPLADICN